MQKQFEQALGMTNCEPKGRLVHLDSPQRVDRAYFFQKTVTPSVYKRERV